MTDIEIRILIAEACGKLHQPEGRIIEYQRWEPQCEGIFMRVKFEDGSVRPCYVAHIPDYPNDLNAMHEAEKVLNNAGEYQKQLDTVWRNSEHPASLNAWIWHCTARQRAEAFLRTLGKWKE